MPELTAWHSDLLTPKRRGKASHAQLGAVAEGLGNCEPGQEMPGLSHLFPTELSSNSEWAEPARQ